MSSDSAPTQRFWNTGTGQALQADGEGVVESLLVTQRSSMISTNATIAPLRIIASMASQAVFSVGGVFISTASMNLSAGQTAFHIPVYHDSQKIWGFIAVSKGVA